MEIQSTPVFKRIMELQGSPLYRAMNSPELRRLQSLLNDEFWDDEPRHTAAIHAPALEHRTPQNNDTAPTKQAPRNAAPNHEDEKQRTTNLERAVRVAMESIHRSTGRCATLDELIHYLKESDETGYILGAIGDEIAWSNTKGEKSTTGRRGIQKHWKKYAITR